MNVFKYQPVNTTYSVGDDIPVDGKSYSYPDDMDILVMRDSAAVLIRNRNVKDIIALEEYEYSGVPVVNGRGFGLNISSQDDAQRFISEYCESTETGKELYDKWLDFGAYRKISIR